MEILSSPLHCLRYVETMIHLYEEQEQGDTGISRAFVDAAQIAIAHGNLARGCVFAERAISRWRVSGGDDDAQVLKLSYLVVTPSKLSVYGLSMKWKTEMEEVPTGLDVAECEDWLWRREKSGLKCQPRIVIDQKIFPGFVNLPDMSGGLMDTRQEYHCCFLGEITNSSILHHLRLELKDVDNRKVKLHFYTESLGSEWTPSQIKKGYTVAVLNAKRHVFRFDDPGICHESLDMLRVRFHQFLNYNLSFSLTHCSDLSPPPLQVPRPLLSGSRVLKRKR